MLRKLICSLSVLVSATTQSGEVVTTLDDQFRPGFASWGRAQIILKPHIVQGKSRSDEIF